VLNHIEVCKLISGHDLTVSIPGPEDQQLQMTRNSEYNKWRSSKKHSVKCLWTFSTMSIKYL